MDCTAISAAVSEVLRLLQSIPPHAISSSLDTVYSKYSKSNYGASEQEIPSIREIITQREEQVHEINTIIQRAETIVHRLRERRDQVVSSMKMHKSFVSRIRRLPIDILSEIFMQCLPKGRYISPNTRAAPLLLTWVCRHWREVALDTPRLWRSFAVWSGDLGEQRVSYYEYCIKNARPCPLRLHLVMQTNSQDNTALINFSRRYTNRCMDLAVFFGNTPDLCRLLGDVPILERLFLNGDIDMPEQEISIVQPHPRLRTLLIESRAFPVNVLTRFNPGWANLTHLVVNRGYGPSSVLGESRMFSMLLQICPNLDHFIFSPVWLNQHDNQVSLTHPKLRVLGIINLMLQNNYCPLQDTFTFPNLHRLHVDFHDSPATILDTLSVSEQPSLDGSGRRIFSITGNVDRITAFWTHLQVFNPGWTDLTHIRLDVKGTAALVTMSLRSCPHLEEIVFSSTDGYPHNDTPVTHPMLRSLVLHVKKGPVGTLLDTLTLPGLHHLDLTLPQGSDWPHAIFKEFVSRSECLLETLDIKGANISAQEQEELTSLVPTSRCLEHFT